jgi:hypothetical protein
MNEELNTLLRSKKILQVERHLSESSQGLLWCFCVTYLDGSEALADGRGERVVNRKILDEESFQRFAALRNAHLRLLQKSKLRFIRKMKRIEEHYQSGTWSEEACARHAWPLVAFTEHADAQTFRKNVLLQWNGQPSKGL